MLFLPFNTTDIVETVLYNLTRDEAPAVIYFGHDRTEQWLLVRLQQDSSQQPAQTSAPSKSPG